jgi:hypothetical protein
MASVVLAQRKVSVDGAWLDHLIVGIDPTENIFLVDLRGGTLTQR